MLPVFFLEIFKMTDLKEKKINKCLALEDPNLVIVKKEMTYEYDFGVGSLLLAKSAV